MVKILKSKAEKLEFDVLENGLDFILHSVQILSGEPEPRELKYAVLSLSAGVELILKKPLEDKHWSLVFKDVNLAKFEAYKNSAFFCVSFRNCIKRLANICDIELKISEIQAIQILKNRRNKLQHFGIIDNKEAIIASTIPVLNFAINFIIDNIEKEELSTLSSEILEEIRTTIPKFADFVQERLKKIDLPKNSTIITCPICTIDTLEIDDGGKCYFCGYSADGETIADKYVEQIIGFGWQDYKGGGVSPLFFCPECGSESFFPIGHDFDDDYYLCSVCGNKWPAKVIGYCSLCTNPYIKNGSAICPDCMSYRIQND